MHDDDPDSRIRVLVVDDDDATVEMLALLLTRRGFDVYQASNLRDAYDLVLTESPDVAVTDLEMPDGDGFELREAIAGTELAIPVIAISGSADPRVLARARTVGFSDVLAKPIDTQRLAAAILRVLGPLASGDVYPLD